MGFSHGWVRIKLNTLMLSELHTCKIELYTRIGRCIHRVCTEYLTTDRTTAILGLHLCLYTSCRGKELHVMGIFFPLLNEHSSMLGSSTSTLLQTKPPRLSPATDAMRMKNAEYTNRESEKSSMPPSPHSCIYAPVELVPVQQSF